MQLRQTLRHTPTRRGRAGAIDSEAASAALRHWRIGTRPDDLREGLFGQTVLWLCELLPALARLGVVPQWDIRSRLYGTGPDWQLVPGVLEPAFTLDRDVDRHCALVALRARHVSVLGNDWAALHELWSRYFRVPQRLLQQADALALPPGTVGVHFRGTDKNLSTRDTNPVSIGDLLSLVDESLETRQHTGRDVPALFIATDEFAFVEAAQRRFPGLPVHNLGPVPFHKGCGPAPYKADRAMLDCVLLSRCSYLLKCSSALSGFAKVLNPHLEVHRVAASKAFFGGIPYFPDAYIPRLEGRSAASRAILARQFEGDWLDDAALAARFQPGFVSLPRYSQAQASLNSAKYALSVALGRPRIA